jgi:mRNA interferase MazF
VKRGDLVTVALSSDYGKPRPALVIQADAFAELGSVTVLVLTSDLHDWPTLRLTVAPTPINGLRAPSQIMIDKAATLPRAKVGPPIGHLDPYTMQTVSKALVAFFGLEGS